MRSPAPAPRCAQKSGCIWRMRDAASGCGKGCWWRSRGPNVGKSSLLNALAGREAAIVSARAGTTRDVVEARLDLGGVPVTLADTAGLREARDEIEVEGIRRARRRAEEADLVLAVFATDQPPDAETLAWVRAGTLVVANKLDLAPAPRMIGGKCRSAFPSARVRGWRHCAAALLTKPPPGLA